MADLPERPSYLKYAFANVYNLSLLAGAAVASAATADWGIAAIAGGLEALWLLLGADSAPFRRWVERQHRAALSAQSRESRRARILALRARADREGAIDLVEAWQVMGRELEKNQHWGGELMREEYARLEELLDAFVELAEAADRFESYLAGFDPARLRRDLAAQRKLSDAPAGDPEARALAGQNAGLLEKRIGTLEEMSRLVQRTRGQMGVIQNTFSLLRDQIVSLKPPQDVHGQLDEIVAGVSAVRAVLAEGDQELRKADPLRQVAEAPASGESTPDPAGPDRRQRQR
jgi:hypothetical protein